MTPLPEAFVGIRVKGRRKIFIQITPRNAVVEGIKLLGVRNRGKGSENNQVFRSNHEFLVVQIRWDSNSLSRGFTHATKA
jgi:hypothetical protein